MTQRFRHAAALPGLFALATLGCVMLHAGEARAEASGPDSWEVTGVAPDDVLNIRAAPMATAPILGTVPPAARGLVNLGCNTPSFAKWMAMSPTQQKQAARNRWCRIRHDGVEGWVRGRYLREGS